MLEFHSSHASMTTILLVSITILLALILVVLFYHLPEERRNGFYHFLEKCRLGLVWGLAYIALAVSAVGIAALGLPMFISWIETPEGRKVMLFGAVSAAFWGVLYGAIYIWVLWVEPWWEDWRRLRRGVEAFCNCRYYVGAPTARAQVSFADATAGQCPRCPHCGNPMWLSKYDHDFVERVRGRRTTPRFPHLPFEW